MFIILLYWTDPHRARRHDNRILFECSWYPFPCLTRDFINKASFSTKSVGIQTFFASWSTFLWRFSSSCAEANSLLKKAFSLSEAKRWISIKVDISYRIVHSTDPIMTCSHFIPNIVIAVIHSNMFPKAFSQSCTTLKILFRFPTTANYEHINIRWGEEKAYLLASES